MKTNLLIALAIYLIIIVLGILLSYFLTKKVKLNSYTKESFFVFVALAVSFLQLTLSLGISAIRFKEFNELFSDSYSYFLLALVPPLFINYFSARFGLRKGKLLNAKSNVAPMTEHEKVFSIINPIIFGEGKKWEEVTEPFSMDDLYEVLDNAGAIKRVAIGVTIHDYIRSLVEQKIVKHLGEGVYQKDAQYCENFFKD